MPAKDKAAVGDHRLQHNREIGVSGSSAEKVSTDRCWLLLAGRHRGGRLLPLGCHYTSLGYGDLIISPSWKLLGPLETANGMLLFGVSTAMIFAVIQRLVKARFVDQKD